MSDNADKDDKTEDKTANSRKSDGVPPSGAPTGGPEKPVGERSLEDKPKEEVSIADKSLNDGDLIVSDDPGPLPEQELDVLDVRHGMFGVTGSGDTSGYGGLVRTVTFPGSTSRPYGGYFDAVADRLDSVLERDGISGAITKVVVHRGEITFHVDREHLSTVMQQLRDDADLRFELLSGVSGVHYPNETDAELHAVYHLLSMTHNRRIRVECACPDADPHVPSVVAIYPTADWHERETYDFFGIIFDGHPALTRIEMPDDWPGHPQRKDYPLGGIPVEYKGATIPPPDQRRSYN
jgi:NADH-quinone oxidoreductase subunit C